MSESQEPRTDIFDIEDESNVIPLTTIARGLWLMAKICVPLAVGAVIVAAMFFDFKTGVIAGFAGFVLMTFIAIPLVLAIIEDEVLDVEH